MARNNTSEGGTPGANVLAGDSGNGDAFDQVTASGSGATGTYSTAQAMHGAKSLYVTGGTTGSWYARWNGIANAQAVYRFYLRLHSFGGAQDIAQLFNTSSAIAHSVGLSSTGQLQIKNAAGTTLKAFLALSLDTWYRVEVQVNTGTTTSNGTVSAQYYLGDSGTPVEAGYTGTGVNTSGVNASYFRLGKPGTTIALDMYLDDIGLDSATSTPLGVPATPPTAAFTHIETGTQTACDGTSSTAAGSATITGYAWTFGDAGTATGATPTHTYASASTYTVTLTVTDSNGLTNSVSKLVTVTTPASVVKPTAVISATGWTAVNAADIITAVSDSDQGTWAASPDNPSASTLKVRLAAMSTPAAGTDMTVTVEVDRTSATSGTASAKLYEGATTRATAAGQAVASATAGSPTTQALTFTFLAASISAVTSWNALDFELTVTAA